MSVYRLGKLTPEIDPLAWVAPSATVIGQVSLAKNVSIWWGATLRGDTDHIVVGENSNIQDNSVLHTDPGLQLLVGRDVTVGHSVILHGCTIGDGCLIGMGATLLNRSVIGKNSIVGANTLIPEGKTYPERSLIIGTPGRVIRQLSDEEVARLSIGIAHYIEKSQAYRRDLLEI